MLLFLTHPNNFPFLLALLVLVIMAINEGVGLLIGINASDAISHLIPENFLNVDGADIENPSTLSKALSWLRIGQIPFVVILVIFLAAFGLIGLFIQKINLSLFGYLMPAVISILPAFVFAILCVRFTGRILARIMPQDETTAVSLDTLIGRVATIIVGNASTEYAAQAKVKDAFGKYHYIMIEPDNKQDVFLQGSSALLVRRNGSKFYAIENNNQIMQVQR